MTATDATAATATRPNILMITTDQQRFDALGFNNPGSSLQTPCLDDLAAHGVNFTRAYATCPVCIPARRSLLSGLHPVTHGLRHYQDGLEWEAPISMPGVLAAHGYQTELVGKLHLHPQRKRYGYQHMVRTESSNDRWDTPLQPTNDYIDWMKRQGYEFPNDIGVNGNSWVARPWDKPEHLHQTSYLANQAVEFVTRYRDPSCPFFLHLSFIAPHPPLTPPQVYWDRYFDRHTHRPVFGDWVPEFDSIPRGAGIDSRIGPFSAETMAAAAAGYFGLINHIDDRIRFVLNRLFEYGSPRAKEPTLIIFTSDHGEMLGDHHLWRKSLPYEGSAHIPFFVAWRNLDLKPGICDGLVCLEDLCATVFDLCGIERPAAYNNPLDSRSLLGALRGQTCRPREALFGECRSPRNHFVVSGELKYIWYPDTHEEQLFDVLQDPGERHDLSADTGRLKPFRERLAQHLTGRTDYTYEPAKLTPCANQPPREFWPARG